MDIHYFSDMNRRPLLVWTKLWFFAGLWLLAVVVYGQGKGRVVDAAGNTLFSLDDNRVVNARNEVLFTISGNILFYGNSLSKDSIAYLVRTRDVFGKKLGYIYGSSTSDILFSVSRGQFFAGTGRFADQLLLEMHTTNQRQVVFIDGQTDDTIGTCIGQGLSAQEWSALFLTWMEGGMPGERKRVEEGLEQQARSRGQVIGRMKLSVDSGFYFEWIWDGQRMKPRYGNRPEDDWIFDGRYIRPYWGLARQEEWEWDGQYLKPSLQDVPELTFIWDGTSIRPFWDYRQDLDWIIEGNIAYPKWDRTFEREWEIEGEFPVPLVALIVLGIADR